MRPRGATAPVDCESDPATAPVDCERRPVRAPSNGQIRADRPFLGR